MQKTQPDYRSIYSRDWRKYLSQEIHPAESVFLGDWREQWPRTRLLDLGVGTGRTTWAFAPLVDQYVGVDIVPEMVEHCLQTFETDARRQFLVGDAQDLRRFESGSFDAVLFSFNGIDHLSPGERAQSLREIHRVLRAGGRFFFSSHSLTVFPHHPSWPRLAGRNPLQWIQQRAQARRTQRRYEVLNAQVASEEVQEKGWAILSDGSHDGDLEIYYCYPWAQKAQLEETGFKVDKVLTNLGKPIPDLRHPTPSWWNYYSCRK